MEIIRLELWLERQGRQFQSRHHKARGKQRTAQHRDSPALLLEGPETIDGDLRNDVLNVALDEFFSLFDFAL